MSIKVDAAQLPRCLSAHGINRCCSVTLAVYLALALAGCGVVPSAPEYPPPPEPAKPWSTVSHIWGTGNGEVFFACKTAGRATILGLREGSWYTVWVEETPADSTYCANFGVLNDIWCSPEGDLFAALSSGAILRQMVGQEIAVTCRPPDLTATIYTSIHGFSVDNVFALDQFGGVAHFDGSSWSWLIPNFSGPYTQPSYLDMWGPSADSIYFGGERGRVYHFDGDTVTSEVAILSEGDSIGELWGRSDSDIYALIRTSMGNGNIILHRNETGWNVAARFEVARLRGLFGLEQGSAYVIAFDDLGSRIMYEKEGSWAQHGEFPDLWLGCIWGDGPGNLYAGGRKISSRMGVIIQFDGTEWKEILSLPI